LLVSLLFPKFVVLSCSVGGGGECQCANKQGGKEVLGAGGFHLLGISDGWLISLLDQFGAGSQLASLFFREIRRT
jgi:hypothetical protein